MRHIVLLIEEGYIEYGMGTSKTVTSNSKLNNIEKDN